MRKLEKENNSLILRDSPNLIRVFGSFFILGGLLCLYMIGGGASNFHTLKRWEILAGTFIGFGVLFGGMWFTFQHPTIVTRIDRVFRYVEISRKWLFKTNVERVGFNEIKSFVVERRFDGEGDAYYDIALETLDERNFDITISWARGDADELREINEQLNKFIK